ncbi:MAG: hypothetical protein JRI23_17140 [Deltaproteobacteria bacterium]|jgi:hypothetical protein|nr:hypothetical protein [Deltaproteobacteria bacterium]MBW2533537.1 hypothetical protein [Deltaproteobacteria bacterium]
MITGRSETLRAHLAAMLAADDRPAGEVARLAELMALFAELGPPPDPQGLFERYPALHQRFVEAAHGDDAERCEERFLELYCHVHGYEAPYTPTERACVNATGGYWCHAGGLSPILKAAPWISSETVSADLGAGNGLQGLLLQKLYPHARTVQIEISSRMVAAGKHLQRWLDVPPERVEWRVDDVRNASVAGLDFIYLYRPLKPVGVGEDFYRRLVTELSRAPRPVVVFSIADCLEDYLPDSFERLYDDGHLRCFRGPLEIIP